MGWVLDEAILSAFATLIVVLDPVGLIPIFLVLTGGMSERQRVETALWAVLIATLILVFFAVFGGKLLAYLGISISAFRIAGGLMLFYTAFEMVFGDRASRRAAVNDGPPSAEHVRAIAAFPLAIPLMAGPGAITASILLAGQTGAGALGVTVLIGVIIVSLTVCLACYLAAGPIDRVIGPTSKIVLTRLLGVLLSALAVQFIIDGVVAVANQVR